MSPRTRWAPTDQQALGRRSYQHYQKIQRLLMNEWLEPEVLIFNLHDNHADCCRGAPWETVTLSTSLQLKQRRPSSCFYSEMRMMQKSSSSHGLNVSLPSCLSAIPHYFQAWKHPIRKSDVADAVKCRTPFVKERSKHLKPPTEQVVRSVDRGRAPPLLLFCHCVYSCNNGVNSTNVHVSCSCQFCFESVSSAISLWSSWLTGTVVNYNVAPTGMRTIPRTGDVII